METYSYSAARPIEEWDIERDGQAQAKLDKLRELYKACRTDKALFEVVKDIILSEYPDNVKESLLICFLENLAEE